MQKLLVRHGLSFANDKESLAFGRMDAPLRLEGVGHAVATGRRLRLDFLADPHAGAATSEALRTQQTACCAGFVIKKSYSLLNEVDISGYPNFREILANEVIIPEACSAAERVFANPPAEDVWFTHGYLIMAIGDVLGIQLEPGVRLKPQFGEVRPMQINI